MILTKRNPHRDHTPTTFAVETIQELREHYFRIFRDKVGDAFERHILERVYRLDEASIDEPSDMAARFVDGPDDVWLGPMYISCAYCLRAISADSGGDVSVAWTYVADGQYWCGMTYMLRNLDALQDQFVAEVIEERARRGGTKSSHRFKATKETAFRLASEMRPKGRDWPSRKNAMESIWPEVLKFSLKTKHPLTETSGPDTVYRWLAEMPMFATRAFSKADAGKSK
jgi:hypothetical protein